MPRPHPNIPSTTERQNHVPALLFFFFDNLFHSDVHHNKEEKICYYLSFIVTLNLINQKWKYWHSYLALLQLRLTGNTSAYIAAKHEIRCSGYILLNLSDDTYAGGAISCIIFLHCRYGFRNAVPGELPSEFTLSEKPYWEEHVRC